MKLLSLGVVATSAVLLSLVPGDEALPVQLDRRDPVSGLLKYVVDGVTGGGTKYQSATKPAPPPTVPLPTQYQPASAEEAQMLGLVNKLRCKLGLSSVSPHPAMTNAATQHSNYQARIRQMTHNNPEDGQLGQRLSAQGFRASTSAENVYYYPGGSIQEVFDGWVNEPMHYQNLVKPDNVYMGVACVNSYWTQEFGSSMDDDTSAYKAMGTC
ncbi:hypothetical protein GGF46_003834 [Coemansia sp. RSA 552]|nr:hypothetical protein GGF46_003834 [Coemansia sp. RSA 552]